MSRKLESHWERSMRSMRAMRSKFLVRLAGGLLAALLPASAFAAGFGVSEFDSTYGGRAYSGSALFDSPSAVYWSPANISRLDGLQINLGIGLVMPRWEYRPLDGSAPVKTDFEVSTPPSFSLSYNLGAPVLGDMAVGIGLYIPFGAALSWPDGWAGQQEVQAISLRVWEITPTFAWRLHDMVAIGGSLRLAPASVSFAQGFDFATAPDGLVELAGSAFSVGGAAGISFYPFEGLSFAFNWRSGMSLTFTGKSNFTFPPPFDALAIDRDVEAQIDLPHKLVWGVAFAVLPELTLSADVTYELWSSYKELKIVFIDDAGGRLESISPRDSNNILQVKAGVEYKIGEIAAIRAGYLYDPTIAPEHAVGPAPPDSDTHVIALGGSFYYGIFGVHAHFLMALFAERETRTSPFPARYAGGHGPAKAFITGLSVSANFDVPSAFARADVPADAAADGDASAETAELSAELVPAFVEAEPADAEPETFDATPTSDGE